ncbi:MAG TPA: two-component regulator propeller domain-containing protein [Verrucomicrobiales bacterium]|nr:two-component regulator propeller domain-containing protein [Verrucomicrobiales bacterium]
MNKRTTLRYSAVLLLIHCGTAPAQVPAPKADARDQTPVVAVGEVVSELAPAIWRVHQARNGDYWFGSTDRGVYRYDGKTLVNYTAKDGLSFDATGRIQEDKAGNVYFETTTDAGPGPHGHGVSRFDGKAFRPLTVPGKAAPADVWKLQPDDLWFGGGGDTGTVLRYDGKTLHRLALPHTKEGDDHFAKYPRSKFPNMKYSPYDCYFNYRDTRGHLWFCTANLGVCHFDGKSFTWLPESELQNGSFGTRSVIEDKDGKFWFCDSLHRYTVELSDKSGPRFKKEEGIRDARDSTKPRIEGIMSSVVDNTGVLWMATYGTGVWRYDGKDATRYPVKDGENEITLFTIARDNRGDLWLGTHTAGAWKFNGKAFEKFKP